MINGGGYLCGCPLCNFSKVIDFQFQVGLFLVTTVCCDS